MLHLDGSRKIHCNVPGKMRTIYWFTSWSIKLPDVVASVSVAERSGKHIKICVLPYIVCTGCAKVFRVETNRVVFVQCFTIEHGFYRSAIVNNLQPVPDI